MFGAKNYLQSKEPLSLLVPESRVVKCKAIVELPQQLLAVNRHV